MCRAWDAVAPIAELVVPTRWMLWIYRGLGDDRVMAYLQRVAKQDGERRVELSTLGREWAKRHPALQEYLTETKYPDGGERKTSTLMLFVDAGEWKGCLRDRDTSRTLWVTAGSLPELLTTLEATLASGGGDWRQEKAWEPRRGKKGS